MKSKFYRKQSGMTLMEIIAALAIVAAVVVGAMSLFNNASSTNVSTQLVKDINAVRSATQNFFLGQGNYGTTSLNAALIIAAKVPATMPTATPVINTQLGGTLTVTGNTTNFRIAITNVPASVCSSLLTNSAVGWSSVQVGTSPVVTTFPISPAIATAAAQCGGTPPFTITWTTIN